MKYVVTVLEDVAEICHTYLPIKAAIFSVADVCGQEPFILLTM
jgi:hypothetical protein